MNEYRQIIQRATQQGIDFSKKHIIIPREENAFVFDGELVFGRIFENDDILYILREVETSWGSEKQPFLYRITDSYETWIQGDMLSYKIEFYTVE